MPPPRSIVAIIGTGGMGLAAARRLACGRRVFLADFSQPKLEHAARSLQEDGHDVSTHLVDVADFASVSAFAAASSAAGTLSAVVHTAGLSPAMAPPRRIFDVDLVGTANVVDAFAAVAPPGSSLTCVASIARFMAAATLSADLARHFRSAPRGSLLDHPELVDPDKMHPALAYAVSKQANFLRVQAAARAFGERGSRINCVSPGVVMTAMVRQETEADNSAIASMIASNPLQRAGTPDDIASVVAFLAGPEAAYVNGSDVVVDGGSVAAGWDMFSAPASSPS